MIVGAVAQKVEVDAEYVSGKSASIWNNMGWIKLSRIYAYSDLQIDCAGVYKTMRKEVWKLRLPEC